MNTPLQHDLDRVLRTMAAHLRAVLDERRVEEPLMVGIHTGGVWIAERLHRLLDVKAPLGTLDISFYRDDFQRIGMHPQVQPSNLPFDINDRHVILVDDVLQSGRTIRAAMNELFDYGRPASIILAILVERSGRELPVQADVAGLSMDLAATEQVKLGGPEPLTLSLQRSK